MGFNAKKFAATVGFALLVLALLITGTGDHKDAKVEDQHYCEMVELYKRSGGENGWPAYKGKCE